jgi:hypothetical protein
MKLLWQNFRDVASTQYEQFFEVLMQNCRVGRMSGGDVSEKFLSSEKRQEGWTFFVMRLPYLCSRGDAGRSPFLAWGLAHHTKIFNIYLCRANGQQQEEQYFFCATYGGRMRPKGIMQKRGRGPTTFCGEGFSVGNVRIDRKVCRRSRREAKTKRTNFLQLDNPSSACRLASLPA